MKIDWLEYVRTKNIEKNGHEEDLPTDNSKVGNRHRQKFRRTGNRKS